MVIIVGSPTTLPLYAPQVLHHLKDLENESTGIRHSSPSCMSSSDPLRDPPEHAVTCLHREPQWPPEVSPDEDCASSAVESSATINYNVTNGLCWGRTTEAANRGFY